MAGFVERWTPVLAVTCVLLAGAAPGARAQSWTFETFDDHRSGGVISQAEVADADGYRMIVRCEDAGQAWLSVRFGQDDPQWPGDAVALRARIGSATYDLGSFQYSLAVYEAPVSTEFIAALRTGGGVTLEGVNFGFERTFGLAGSERALGNLACG